MIREPWIWSFFPCRLIYDFLRDHEIGKNGKYIQNSHLPLHPQTGGYHCTLIDKSSKECTWKMPVERTLRNFWGTPSW
jgi:hypothetical protein